MESIIRKPSGDEIRLLNFLLKQQSNVEFSEDHVDGLMVKPLNDGAMGSLLLIPKGINNIDRSYGRTISEYLFKDLDGIDVIASLFLDENGFLFELDMWKTDFSPILKIPSDLE